LKRVGETADGKAAVAAKDGDVVGGPGRGGERRPIVEDAANGPAPPAAPKDATPPSAASTSADDTDEGAPVIEDGDNDPKKAVLRQKARGELLKVTAGKVREYLGTEKFRRHDKDSHDQIGVTNGLAWTPVGGEMLMTEVSVTPGRGKLATTGKLGDVMQESAQAAMSYVRSRARQLA